MTGKTTVAFGEILWDLLPDGRKLGGAPFNFAYRINTLGQNGVMTSRLGRDALGKEAMARAGELGMDCAFLQWDETHPTGTVNVTLDEKNQPDYEITPGVAYDYIESTQALVSLAQECDCLCFGTLAQRAPVSRGTLETLLNAAEKAFKLLDINLRKNCYTGPIIHESLRRADAVKLNDDEARYLNREFNLNADGLPELAEAILRRWELEVCLMTLGEQGVFAVSKNGDRIYEPGYEIPLVDPIGSGDACAAGYISQRLDGATLLEACRHGNALGALAATHPGPTGFIPPGEPTAFLNDPPQRIIQEDLRGYWHT